MNLRIFITFFSCLFSLANDNLLYANGTVGSVWKSENVALPQGRIAYIDPSTGTIYEVNLDGVVTWKYQIPDEYQQKGNMRTGADIEWVNKSDHFLFVVPEGGIYEVFKCELLPELEEQVPTIPWQSNSPTELCQNLMKESLKQF